MDSSRHSKGNRCWFRKCRGFSTSAGTPRTSHTITASVSYLVSRDNDILDLADASTPGGERLRHQAPELQILEPGAFLVEVRHKLQDPGRD